MSASTERVDAAVSYSRADQSRVERIITGLKARGVIVWFDRDIPGGALWEEIIARKYRASGALLFFVSKASLASQRCSEEVSTARTLGKPIIPILLEPLKLPDDLPDRFVLTLQARNTVEAHDRSTAETEAAIVAALSGFGVTPGGTPSLVGPAIAVTTPAPSEPPEERRKRGGALIAFGGAAIAIALVAGAYVLFVQPSAPPTSAVGTSGSPVASAPPAKPGPRPDPKPEAAPDPTPKPQPTPPKPTKEASGPTTVKLDKPSYVEGDQVLVTVGGLPGNDKDWVALAAAGSPDSAFLSYVYTSGKTDGTVSLKRIMKAGAYEVRVYFDDTTGDKTVRARVAFEVAPFPPPTLTLDRASYAEGEPITATVSGMLGTAQDWVAIAKADAPPDAYLTFVYVKGGKAGELALKPVMQAGKYEVRAYFDDSTGDKTIRARVPFEVTPAEPVALMPDGDSYAPGAPMDVDFSGMPGNARDWISIAKAGSDDTAYLSYVNTSGKTSGTAALRAPQDEGSYELRAYFDDSSGDKTVRGRTTFEVSDGNPGPSGATPEAQPAPPEETDPAPEPEAEPGTDPVAEPQPDPAANQP